MPVKRGLTAMTANFYGLPGQNLIWVVLLRSKDPNPCFHGANSSVKRLNRRARSVIWVSRRKRQYHNQGRVSQPDTVSRMRRDNVTHNGNEDTFMNK